MNFIDFQKRIIVSVRRSPDPWIVGLAAFFGFFIKLLLDLTTFGTNDVTYWWTFSNYIATHDSFSIYRDIRYYNHPPLISYWLWVMELINGHNKTQFAHLLRLPAILADIGSTVIIWRLVKSYFTPRKSLVVTCIFALSPVSIMVSGFHGNTDPVFMFLILLSSYLLINRRSWLPSALILGAAMNVKLVPIIMLPAMCFWLQTWTQRFSYGLVALLLVGVGCGYHFYVMTDDMLRNVFLYGGLKNIWGIGRFYRDYPDIGKLIVFVTITAMSFLISQKSLILDDQRKERSYYLLRSFSWTFLLFLLLTPGFGVQYLSWLVAPVTFLGVPVALVYNLLAGLFLFRVYTFWSGGFPWYYANSNVMGQWVGFDRELDLLLWCLLAIVLIVFGLKNILELLNKWKQKVKKYQ